MISRRAFLHGAAAAGALLSLAPLRSLARAAAENVPARFTKPLPRLSELTASDITLTAAVADVPLLDGAPTSMWTFNGSFPGPIIRRPSGSETRVTVVNKLPASAGTLTIHHHGGHQESVDDGQPEGAPIGTDQSRLYTYPLIEDGAPERGAMQWYHDHTHRETSRRAWMGLIGLFILEDGFDAELGLPTGAYDIPLVVTDRSFTSDNQLTDPYATQAAPPSDEVTGDVVLVNGAPAPYLDVEARRYRFRVLNASNFRIYNIALSDGTPLVQIATESGLLPNPITRPTVTLGPAERAEIIVDLTGRRGAVDLVSVPFDGTDAVVPRSGATGADILRLNVGPATSPETTTVPAALRPLPEWVAELTTAPDRVWVFSMGVDPTGATAWTVNGMPFDPSRVDARPELGTTETWLFVNTGPVPVSHYVHMHDVDWYLLERNGAPALPEEAGLKETFRLDPGEAILVGTKFTDHLGRYMVHCHMLDHEDHGMMTTFEVVPAGQGDRTTAPSLASLPPVARDVVTHAAAAKTAAPMSLLQRPLPRITTPVFCELR